MGIWVTLSQVWNEAPDCVTPVTWAISVWLPTPASFINENSSHLWDTHSWDVGDVNGSQWSVSSFRVYTRSSRVSMWAKLSVPSVLLTTVTYAAKVQQDKQSSFSFSAGEVEKWGGGLFFLNEELNVLDSFVPQGRLGGKYGQYARRHIKFGGPERYNIISCMSPGV